MKPSVSTLASQAVEVFEAMPEPAVHANGGPDHGGQPDELPEEARSRKLRKR